MTAAPVDVWGPAHGADPDEVVEKAIVAALPLAVYRRGFHATCGGGSLTARLAEVCDRLCAIDPSSRRVLAARGALKGRPGVDVQVGDLVTGWPPGHFDLIVLVDVLTQLTEADLTVALHTAALAARSGATLVVAQTRGDQPGDVRTEGEVHLRVHADVRWTAVSSMVQDGLVLDVLQRR